MVRGLLLVATVLAGTGCGGIISSVFIIQGTVALAGARSANAETLATYEYVSAEAYLKKAREAHSYSDFEHSLRFARLAAERASIAKKKALDLNKPQEAVPTVPDTQVTDPNAAPPQSTPPPQQYAPPQQQYAPPPQQQYAPPPAATTPPPANRPPVIIRQVPDPEPAPAPAPTPIILPPSTR